MTEKEAHIRIVLADDHGLVRAGLRLLLDNLENIEVIGEAKDGDQAIELVKRLRPTIALLDISMPGMTGLAALKEIRAHHPETKVMLLSMYDNTEYVTEAIRSGAVGYLIKDGAEDELAVAVNAVNCGEVYLSPRIARMLAGAYNKSVNSDANIVLTNRQTQVLVLIAKGHASKGIARELNLSTKTVETYRAQLVERLGIREVAGLVRYAIRTGLVSQDD